MANVRNRELLYKSVVAQDIFRVLYDRHQTHGGELSILESEIRDALGLDHVKGDKRIYDLTLRTLQKHSKITYEKTNRLHRTLYRLFN